METASVRFLAFGVGVAVCYNLFRPVAWRQAVLLIANTVFLATFVSRPWMLVPLVGFLVYGYSAVRWMRGGLRRAFPGVLLLTIGLFIWLKRYTFLPHSMFLSAPYTTIGLSYIFFRVLHLIIDTRNDDLPERITLVSYLNYTLNFATLVSGPIQLYPGFAETHLARERPALTILEIGRAAERIVRGFFKVEVLSMVFSGIQQHAIKSLSVSQPLLGRAATGAILVAVYPIYLYCNFSGYMDVVIGLAGLMRFRLPENFDRPFSSDNFLNFWSRWHITLSNWFKIYFYNPLLMYLMGRSASPTLEPFLAVFAFFATFFLLGIWHGQNSVFAFYGVVLGLGVSVNKLYQIAMARMIGKKRYKELSSRPLYNVFSRGATYTYYSFCMLWFWSNWAQMGDFVRKLQPTALLLAWVFIFACATLLLSAWETARNTLLAIQWDGIRVLETRYAKTVYATVAVLLTVAVVKLANAPPPQIVYKGF